MQERSGYMSALLAIDRMPSEVLDIASQVNPFKVLLTVEAAGRHKSAGTYRSEFQGISPARAYTRICDVDNGSVEETGVEDVCRHKRVRCDSVSVRGEVVNLYNIHALPV